MDHGKVARQTVIPSSSPSQPWRARLVALLIRLTRCFMRNVVLILIVAFCSMLVIVAAITQNDIAWLLAGLSCILGNLGWAAAQRERRTERRQAGDSAIDHLFDAAVSARQKQSAYQAPQDSSELE
jgi:hypothetical protein